jgi:nitrile hydratase beta subunit
VNSAHDLGGMHGFGAVLREENEPVFHEEWERVVFSMRTLIRAQGLTGTGDAGRHAIERMGNVDYLAASYYERWLTALSTLLIESNVITADELAERVERVRRNPAGFGPPQVQGVDRLAELAKGMFERASSSERQIDRGPKHGVGDTVVTARNSPRGHTRLPRYARGRRGRVVRHHGAHVFPDTNAHGLGECPQHLYTVRFEASELWGVSADGRGCVHIDLWEGYLIATDGEDDW